MLFNEKTCFTVFNKRNYDDMFVISEIIRKLFKERPVLTSQFDVSKLKKQLGSVMQIHLDQSANFGSLRLNACVRVSHNVPFNSINREK